MDLHSHQEQRSPAQWRQSHSNFLVPIESQEAEPNNQAVQAYNYDFECIDPSWLSNDSGAVTYDPHTTLDSGIGTQDPITEFSHEHFQEPERGGRAEEVLPEYLNARISNNVDTMRPQSPQPQEEPLRSIKRKRKASDSDKLEGRQHLDQPRQFQLTPQPTQPSFDISLEVRGFLKSWLNVFFDPSQLDFPSDEDIQHLAPLCKIPQQAVVRALECELGRSAPAVLPNRIGLGYSVPLDTPPSTQPKSNECPRPRRPNRRPQAGFTKEKEQQIANRYRTSRDRACNPGQRLRKNIGHLQCTSSCGYRTNRVDDWKRHEENRQPQALWICKICREDPACPFPFHTHRIDKIGDHIKDKHIKKDAAADLVMERVREQSQIEFEAVFREKCGFCRTKFTSWEMRNKHIISHYKGQADGDRAPRNIEEWDDEWNDDDDVQDKYDDDDDDDNENDGSDDDDNDGGDPREDYGDSNGGEGPSGNDPSPHGHGGYPYDYSWGAGRGPFEGDPGCYGSGDSGQYRDTRFRACGNKKFLPTRFVPLVRSIGVLGRGSHGTVEKVQYHTGEIFARKRLHSVKSSRNASKAFAGEVRIMRKLQHHPNIVRLIRTYQEGFSITMIISPVADFDLRRYLHSPPQQHHETKGCLSWVTGLASALTFLHKNRIRHADIKPANILLRGSQAFITDFSIAREVSEPDSTSSSNSPMTPMYASPEIILSKRHGRKADVFSLGCVYLELVTFILLGTVTGLYDYLGASSTPGEQPTTYQGRPLEVMNWVAALRQKDDDWCCQFLDLCDSMLQHSAADRPTAADILESILKINSSFCVQVPQAVSSRLAAQGTSKDMAEGYCLPLRSKPSKNHQNCLPPQAENKRQQSPHQTLRIETDVHNRQFKDAVNHVQDPNEKFVSDLRKLDGSYFVLGIQEKQTNRLFQSKVDYDLRQIGEWFTSAEPTEETAPPAYPFCINDNLVLGKILQENMDFGKSPEERFFSETNSLFLAPKLPTDIQQRQLELPPLSTSQSLGSPSPQTPASPRPAFMRALSAFTFKPNTANKSTPTLQPQDQQQHPPKHSTLFNSSSNNYYNRNLHNDSAFPIPSSTPLEDTAAAAEPLPAMNRPPSPHYHHPDRRAGGAAAHSDFKHYGRHTNSWLFNDFSVRASAKGAWERSLKRRRMG